MPMWWTLAVAWGAEPHEISASGRSEVVVTAPRFGRYAFEAKSSTGIALQLVDRRSGPGLQDGQIGTENGRVDAFIDTGEIKVITAAPTDGVGKAVLEVTRFERQGDDRVLSFRKPVSTDLDDKQERAWWIEIDGPVAFEAVGRHLGDLRLWRDGTWLDGTRPTCSTIEPEMGRPQQRCVLSGSPEPGLYQLVAYGSPGDPWANDVPETGLYVQWDAPRVAPAGQLSSRIGPTGTNWYVVPDSADTAHLVLPDNAPATVSLAQYSSTDPYRRNGQASITDESRTPEATAFSSHTSDSVIGVSGAPGQPFTVTWFKSASGSIRVSGTGQTLVTSVSTARPSDTLSPTGVLYRGGTKDVQVQSLALTLETGQRFEERFNLNVSTQMWFEVKEKARYKFLLTEGKGKIGVTRFFTTPPKDYRAPPAREGAFDDTLEPGMYIVSILPSEPGIATLVAERNDWTDSITRATSGTSEKKLRPGLMSIVDIDGSSPLMLRFAGAAGARTGIVVRDLPLDPRLQAPINLRGRESFSIPVDMRAAGTLRARTPNGELLPLMAGGTVGTELELSAGVAMVTVTNNTDGPMLAVLGTDPPAVEPMRVPQTLFDKLPDFPTLGEGAPQFLDLDTLGSQTFRLKLDGDGLYEVVSTGLLATRGVLRSRIELELGKDNQGGEGRNFRVGQFMLSGDYQLTVKTQNKSAGHLGVKLRRTPLTNGGSLRDGEIARATVDPGEGVRYTFEVPERGRYHLRSAGQRDVFGCRLEDSGGWPVTRPSNQCDLHQMLEPGTYVLISMPTGVRTLRQTTLSRDAFEENFKGHGPHPIPTSGSVSHTWMEKPGEDPRPEDRWMFTLPADLEVSIALDSEMSGHIEKDGERVDRLTPGRTWSGVLRAGSYDLVLQAARRGTGIPYTVTMGTDAMTIGQARQVTLPGEVPVRIGTDGLVSFSSQGSADVRARLLRDGVVLAANDDRPDGWNFLVDTWLSAGDYTLQLDSVGGGNRTTVKLDSPPQEEGPTLKSSRKAQTLPVDKTTRNHPLAVNTRRPLLVSARSSQNIGIGLETKTSEGWKSLGTASGRRATLLAHPDKGDLRLKVWSLDGRSGEAEFTVSSVSPIAPSQISAAEGIEVDDGELGVMVGANLEPGLYRVAGDRSEMRVCPVKGAPCGPVSGVVAIDGETLILARNVRLERAALGDAVPIELSERGVRLDLDRTLRAVTVRSAAGLPGANLASDSATALSSDSAMAVGRGNLTLRGSGVGRVTVIPLKDAGNTDWDAKGDLRVEIPARSAVTIDGPGKKGATIPLALERGLFASAGGTAVWADTEGVDANLPVRADILLTNPTDKPAIAVLKPPTPLAPELATSAPVERFASRAGLDIFTVTAFDGKLRSHGATLTYLRTDGKRVRGEAIDVGPGGTLWVEHEKGWYAVWTEEDGPWLGKSEALRLTDGVTRIESDEPFAVRFESGDRAEVFWRPEGGHVDLLKTDSGPAAQIRALGGGPVAFAYAPVEVLSIGEGLGPETVLAAGGASWYRFDLPENTEVGIGVRAAADRVTTRVIDANGTTLGTGVVQKLSLSAGPVWVVLEQSADSTPVRVRPALAGLERPDQGPPEAVVRTYLKQAGLLQGGAQ